MKFNFAENVTVKNIEAVPEDFRALYEQQEDKTFKLSGDAKVKSAVAAITGLNQALIASRGETESAKKGRVDLSALAEYGDTPEAILAKVKDTIKALTEGGKVNVDKIRQEIAESFAKDGKAKDTRITALHGQLTQMLVDNAAIAAIAEAKGNEKALMPMLRNSIRVAEKDGKFVVNVVDGQNEIRYSGVTGQPMTIKELVAEVKADSAMGGLFASEAPGGTGLRPGSTHPQPGQGNKIPQSQDPVAKITRGLATLRRGTAAGAGA